MTARAFQETNASRGQVYEDKKNEIENPLHWKCHSLVYIRLQRGAAGQEGAESEGGLPMTT